MAIAWPALLVLPTTEHFLVLSSLLFPPVLFICVLVVLLASFGTSLGLRQRYVDTLIRIFEWGAGEIRSTQIKRNRSQMFDIGDSEEEDEDDADFAPPESNDYAWASDTASAGYDSGISPGSPSLARSSGSTASLRSLRRRHGSSASLGSSVSARARHASGNSIIRRETSIHHLDDEDTMEETIVVSRGRQVIEDSLYFVKAGVEAIIEDEVTSRFQAEQLASWNMLTRTSISFYQFVNWKLTVIWGLGFLFRYVVMLPLRFVLFGVGMTFLMLSTAVVGLVPDGRLKRWFNEKCMLACYRILSRAVTAVVNFHDQENKARSGGICVANHTSPVDVMTLSIDNVYALIGQRHPGLLGVMQRALSRASSHIWFERSEARDRAFVARKLREHVEDPTKLPILIFPEGTCINNTSVMMFKKGCFEVGTKIYPIAMKYDSRFGDAFWNSSEQSWFEYIMRMMTSWAIICNVWYLPCMERQEGESAIDFANRVKKAIAVRGGLVDLEWDGQLKRSKVPPKMVAQQQEKYYHRWSRYTSCSEPQDLLDEPQQDDDADLERHSDDQATPRIDEEQ